MKNLNIDNVLVYATDEKDRVTLGKVTTAIPSTANAYALPCILLGNDGKVYSNKGTLAVPSFQDMDSISTSEIADLAITPAKLAATGAWKIYGDTVEIGNVAKTGYNKLTGHTEIDNRPTGGTADDYALQIRSISAKTSGMHWGLDGETHLGASGTATIRGTQGVAVLDATFTSTGGDLIGTYGQARADGTYNYGGGFVTGLYGLIEASAAMTASHVCSVWADSHQANAVTGSHELFYGSNNGAASMDQMIYLSGQGEALLHLNTAGGPALNYVSDTAETAGASKKIKILIEGVTYYINAYAGS